MSLIYLTQKWGHFRWKQTHLLELACDSREPILFFCQWFLCRLTQIHHTQDCRFLLLTWTYKAAMESTIKSFVPDITARFWPTFSNLPSQWNEWYVRKQMQQTHYFVRNWARVSTLRIKSRSNKSSARQSLQKPLRAFSIAVAICCSLLKFM